MGRAKEAMLIHDENLSAATSYLVERGMLQRCPIHGIAYGGGFGGDLDDEFWKISVGQWKRKEHGDVPWASELEVREFTDLLTEAYHNHPADECYACDKNMRD